MQAHLGESYAVDVSPELIGTVTDAVMAEVIAWPTAPHAPALCMVQRAAPWKSLSGLAHKKTDTPKARDNCVGLRCQRRAWHSGVFPLNARRAGYL